MPTSPSALFTLRPMVPGDYDMVYALWTSMDGIGLGESDTLAGIQAFLARNPGLSLVAIDSDGKIVGTILCGHDGRRGYLHHLAVAKSHRRQGVARKMVNQCLEMLRALRIEKCNIFLYSNNADGRGFWLREGWLAREDLVLAQKDLS